MILNLGCGAKTSERCINIDRNIHIRLAKNPILYQIALRVLSESRANHLRNLRTNIQVHDLSKGIPYPDNSVDAVYHSHVLEHIDRNLEDPAKDSARGFLRECLRVLKPGGILRVVVPDLEGRAQRYLAALDKARRERGSVAEVNERVYEILGQAVRKESTGTSAQNPAQRWLENAVLGDARKRGETHQWEYDSVTLHALLLDAGFRDATVADYQTSGIPDWNDIGLDRQDGHEYKPGSIYVEGRK